jgi:acetyltransferase-like isoleucine patch superfamily enzyme
MTRTAQLGWLNGLSLKVRRKTELLRGHIWRWRGASAGVRFGLGRGVRILYPECLTVGDDVTIEDHAYLHCLSERGVRIGSHTSIDRNLWLHCGGTPDDHSHGWFEIGEHSFIGPNAVIGAGGPIKIGSHVQFGPNVTMTAEQHLFDDPRARIEVQGVVRKGVVVEDDCWIGGQVTILDGLTIGHGTVVGAGAVVTRSIPEMSVAVGVPARVVRTRAGETHADPAAVTPRGSVGAPEDGS